MSPHAHRRLVELDALSREAREFYEHAAAVLPASPLRERCLRLAHTKAELVALLAQRLHRGRDPRIARLPLPRGRSMASTAYARARAGLDVANRASLVREIQRIEAATAQACEREASGEGDADCRRLMAWVSPVLACCTEQAQTGGETAALA